MKIGALVSIVAAGRQARDAQSLFNKMLGDQNNSVVERNFVFYESDNLSQISQFYMSMKSSTGMGFISYPPGPFPCPFTR